MPPVVIKLDDDNLAKRNEKENQENRQTPGSRRTKYYPAEVEMWVESENGKTVTIKPETSKKKEG